MSALCRSRREFSNAYFLANVGFDTAEEEPCKVCPIEQRRERELRAASGERRCAARRSRQRGAPLQLQQAARNYEELHSPTSCNPQEEQVVYRKNSQTMNLQEIHKSSRTSGKTLASLLLNTTFA